MVAVAVVSLANSAFAQPKKVVADRIIGQVGDKIILHSDIFNSIMDAQRQGMALPPNPECVIVQRALIEKAMVLQAEKDSLPVSDDEVDAAIDNQIRGFVMTYGSKEMVEEVAGKTIYQLKEDYKDVFRDRALADQMRKKIVENVKITPNEVKDFFQKNTQRQPCILRNGTGTWRNSTASKSQPRSGKLCDQRTERLENTSRKRCQKI